jgi:hypothetical protein
LELVRRAPYQAYRYLEVRDLLGNSKRVVYIEGADLPDHRRGPSGPLVVRPVLFYRLLRPFTVVVASTQEGAIDLTEDAVG